MCLISSFFTLPLSKLFGKDEKKDDEITRSVVENIVKMMKNFIVDKHYHVILPCGYQVSGSSSSEVAEEVGKHLASCKYCEHYIDSSKVSVIVEVKCPFCDYEEKVTLEGYRHIFANLHADFLCEKIAEHVFLKHKEYVTLLKAL